MEKKKLYYIIGGVAVIGIGVGLYLWNKNKKAVDSIESEDLKTKSAEEKIDVIKKSSKPMVKLSSIAFRPAIATATPTVELAPVIKLTEQELADRLAVCGKKPKLKKNQKLYHECRGQVTDKLKSQGLVAFDGSYSFDGLLDNDFFSGFDSNFDLNL
jgi:hypothetical protein